MMKTLYEALSVERNRLFVGRDSELRLIRNWLTQKDAPTEILFISGMGGIGKSTLLLQFLNLAQNEHIRTIWLDGRICTETPAGFLESLRASLLHEAVEDPQSNSSMKHIAKTLSRKKTLLCIDNYEYIHKIEGWLREVFLPQLSETGILVVMAARQDLSFQWQHNIAWRGRVNTLQLTPLSRTEAVSFYIQTGLNQSMEVEQLISETKGLPLAMALSIESLHLEKSEARMPLATKISAELLREVATTDLQETLNLLCILPRATPDLLKRLLDKPLTTMNIHYLSQLSFVRPTLGGFALHDVARGYLIEDFLHRDPEHFQALRLRVIEELVKDMRQARGDEKKRIASALLSTCRDVFQLHNISIISTNAEFLQMDSFRKTDLPHLHQIMTEEAEYTIAPEDEHALLNSLAEQFPEAIRVFRSAEGIPLAYSAGLLLYKETTAFLDAFIPGIIEACFPNESKRMNQLRLEEANTYYQLLAGVTVRPTDFSFHELVGIMVSDMIIHHSAGLRFVIVTSYKETDQLLSNIGFQRRPLTGITKEHPLDGAVIHEQDWRVSEYGDHILSMLKATSVGTKVKEEVLPLTEKDIHEALPLVTNPLAMGQTELAYKLQCSGAELQEKMQSILHHHPPFPLDIRQQEVLRLLSEMPFLSPELAAERLHISRATYYRLRKESVNALKQILMQYKKNF